MNTFIVSEKPHDLLLKVVATTQVDLKQRHLVFSWGSTKDAQDTGYWALAELRHVRCLAMLQAEFGLILASVPDVFLLAVDVFSNN